VIRNYLNAFLKKSVYE